MFSYTVYFVSVNVILTALVCTAVAKGDQLNVNASAPTAVPLEVQFGTATLNTATTADPNTFSYTVYFVSVSASPTTWVCTAVAKGDQLNVNASVPTAVPLRVRFGTGTPNAATAANLTMFSNPMYPGSQSHAQESRSVHNPCFNAALLCVL